MKRWLVVAFAAALVGSACGGESDTKVGDAPSATTVTPTSAAPTTTAHTDDHGDDHGGDHGEGTGHEDEVDVRYEDLPADIKAQVDITKAYVDKYATAADAERDGWRKATLSLNGIGAHYLKNGPTGFLEDYEFDPANPNVLLFDGEGPDAKIAGASFILTEPNPEGYPGDLDAWHYHYGVCFDMKIFLVIGEVDGHEGSKISFSPEQCEAEGGTVFPIENLHMIHVWLAPGYIEDGPVFAHDHPDLYDGATAESQL